MARGVALIYPTFGHITPALAVVGELVRRGDEIVFYGTGRSRQRIEDAGAGYRAYAAGHDDFNPTPPTDGLFSDMVRLLGLSERLLPELLRDVAALQPDYLLLDSKSIWGRLVAQVLGCRAVTLSVVFAIKPGIIGAGELASQLYGQGPAERMRTGLSALSQYFECARRVDSRFGTTSPDIITFLGNPQPLNVIFTSREFQLQGERFGDSYVFVGAAIPDVQPAPAPPELTAVGDAPLIYVSLGTTFNDAPIFYRACFAAASGAPWQMLISTGGLALGDLGSVPANVRISRFVPQQQILERASVFVTHGGMNSANEAQYFGVPMVVVPQRGDQFLVASRVAELGAGMWLPPDRIDGETLRSQIDTALASEDVRDAAGRLRASCRAGGGAPRAAAAIQRYVAG